MASSTTVGSPSRFAWTKSKWAGFVLLACVPLLYWAAVVPSPSERAASAQCDRAVAAMLESRDPVELQRADLLIRNLNCRVRKRLPREP